jgi:alanine racemase
MSRPIRATIDLGALKHNLAVARRHADAGGARIFSVIKANAYGHGLLPAARALAGLTDGFALLELSEAARLREEGIREPILLLEGFFRPDDLEAVAELGLIPAIHRLDQLEAIEAAALPVKLPVFIKFNSGMHRLGFTPETWPAARDFLAQAKGIGPVAYMTHFAEADSELGITWQLERFQEWSTGWTGDVSLANSATLLRYPEGVRGWVRPGIMLYGGSPFPEVTAEALGLKPVMTLESEIIAVQQVAAGERVGYGGTFTAGRPSRIGVVACGYADGYPRHAPCGTPILVDGRPTGTAGRVSMDMLFCDLTDLPESGIGSRVTLWGEGLSADAVAAAAGTISYELFCALAPRVPVRWREG